MKNKIEFSWDTRKDKKQPNPPITDDNFNYHHNLETHVIFIVLNGKDN